MDQSWIDFAEHVKDGLMKDMNRRSDGLASNMARDIEEYRYGCGVIKGEAYAIEMIDSLIQKAKEGQDE